VRYGGAIVYFVCWFKCLFVRCASGLNR
jgi:hypothetical protein